MSVTITVDIGTSVVPIALPDAAIAYAIQYSASNKATVYVRFYTEADATKATPEAVFYRLAKDMPDVWNPTYSSLSSLLCLKPVAKKYEYMSIVMVYNPLDYTWTIEKDTVKDWIMNMQLGRLADFAEEAIIPKDTIKFTDVA